MRFFIAAGMMALAMGAPTYLYAKQPAVIESLYGTGLRFGMSSVEVEHVLNARIKHGDPHTYDEYSIPDGKYLGIPAEYIFQFSSSGKLVSITMFIKRPEDPSQLESFDAISSGLIKRYGAPVAVRHTVREGGAQVTLDVWTTDDEEVSYEIGPSTFMQGLTALITAEPRVTDSDAVTVPTKTLAAITPGGQVTVRWGGGPVTVIRRSPTDLKKLESAYTGSDKTGDQSATFVTLEQYRVPLSEPSSLTYPQYRSNKSEYGVFLDVDTADGCTLKYMDLTQVSTLDMPKPGFGFYDPCHGDAFDVAGRTLVSKYDSAPLLVPKYHFEPNGDLVIGR